MTILEALQTIHAYPVPINYLRTIAVKRNLSLEAEASIDALSSKDYLLAVADIRMWIALAPNVSETGVSYTFGTDERRTLMNMARITYVANGEDPQIPDKKKPKYGYKGRYL